ncbi:MAG: tetratricopeptide repeat protein [Alphaproteobacteria bacterium]|nr:tetratricopeptide repeat protein [Alphaproteobacteria bacterium]MCB9690420.1 tetratricopeptide repeat protein [Alphaproteobacteria bacterium]
MSGPTDAHEPELLDALGERYLLAVERVSTGDLDRAEDLLRDILRQEPRLAEPNLTLGRLLLDTQRLEPAEEHTRTALAILQDEGQWTEEVPEDVVLSIAHAQLAEILRLRADEDDVIFGDPETFHAIVRESKEHFQKAADLDPSDATSSYYAFFMGPPQSAE